MQLIKYYEWNRIVFTMDIFIKEGVFDKFPLLVEDIPIEIE